jgi:hypothetical protein
VNSGQVKRPTNGSNWIKDIGGDINACVSFKALHSGFKVGLTTIGFPGLPLDPEVLRRRENVKIDWLELEFHNIAGNSSN